MYGIELREKMRGLFGKLSRVQASEVFLRSQAIKSRHISRSMFSG